MAIISQIAGMELKKRIFMLSENGYSVSYEHLPDLFSAAWKILECFRTPQSTLAVDTGDRFQAVLWFIFCWYFRIPFVPFNKENRKPLELYRPDLLIDTTLKPGLSMLYRAIQPGDMTMEQYESTGSVYSFYRRTDCRPTTFKSKLPRHSHVAGSPYSPAGSPADAPVEKNQSNPFFEGPKYPGGLLSFSGETCCGLLTSGTTGKPKKVPVLRRQLISAARHLRSREHLFNYTKDHSGVAGYLYEMSSGNQVVPGVDLSAPETEPFFWGHCMPMNHAAGLAIVFRCYLTGNGIYLWNRFDEEVIGHDLQKIKSIHKISLVPTMLKRLVEYYRTHRLQPPPNLNEILLGGGPDPFGLATAARNSGWPVVYSYGMTETIGQIAVQKMDGSSPEGSAGLPVANHEIRIMDKKKQEVNTGDTGEIWVRGPQVFSGYLSEQEKLTQELSAEIEPYSWFKTGDSGYLDEEGNLFVLMRRTDRIISGGENIDPVRVEKELLQCEGVGDSAVCGMADKEWGQKLTALIVPKHLHGSPAETEEMTRLILEKISVNLQSFEIPRLILYTRHLPRTPLGKLERSKLISEAEKLMNEKKQG